MQRREKLTHLPYFLCRTVAALDHREQPIFSPIHALLNRSYNTNIMFKNAVSRFVFLVPFVDNQNLIISRGVARIFPEVRKSIYYLRLSFTKKSDFLPPFGHCFWLTESRYVDVIILYVHLLRIQVKGKTMRLRFIQSNLLFSPFSRLFS